MRTLYIDCGMGAAGDMLTAALLELLPDPAGFVAELNALGIPGVEYRAESATRCGISGTRVRVLAEGAEESADDCREHDHHVHHGLEHDHHEHHHGDHVHSGLADIDGVLENLPVSSRVREDAAAVFGLIAEAESHVHGVPMLEVHFHEVGTMDALADVTAVCMLMERLAPDEVVASPVHVGSGQVKCAHGILPVPAPATAWLLRDIPIYGGSMEGELCTPTGAALLRRFVTRFGDMPVLRTGAIGYGMGAKEFSRANCVRVLLGETEGGTDRILELSCNVDDMTGEEIGYALERLMEQGAKDVYTVPVNMKKNRPGTLIRVMCDPDLRERMTEALFRYTSTIGVRETACRRYVLDRKVETRATPRGDVRVKKVTGYGVTRQKLEYEDLARIAREEDVSIAEARKMAEEG